MSLKAFDSRMFAVYVERLPHSLDHGIDSPFTKSDAASILHDTSSALAYLEAEGVVHNDIKPANIAYSPARGAVIFDFGLGTSINRTSHAGGTPWYVPPDVIHSGMRGPPGDVWALGVTMLYVLGKTRLPEKIAKRWVIKDVGDEDSDARRLMDKWLGLVESSRKKLDHFNPVESLVHQMLELGHRERIQAAQILTSLKGSK